MYTDQATPGGKEREDGHRRPHPEGEGEEALADARLSVEQIVAKIDKALPGWKKLTEDRKKGVAKEAAQPPGLSDL